MSLCPEKSKPARRGMPPDLDHVASLVTRRGERDGHSSSDHDRRARQGCSYGIGGDAHGHRLCSCRHQYCDG